MNSLEKKGDTDDIAVEIDPLLEKEAGEPTTAVPPGPPPFHFFANLKNVNAMTTHLNGYGVFISKFFLLELICLLGNFSFIVVAFVLKDIDFDNPTTGIYVAFAVVAVLMIASRILPGLKGLYIDKLKQQLQTAQSTAVVAKIFELQHNAVLSTPTGEFSQLLSKIYMNVDKLLPALYGVVIPLIMQVVVAVVLLACLYGPIAVVQVVLFVVYTLLSYKQAEKKAERNKELMVAMFSEWGKILATAGAYERAHYFDRVDYEIEQARGAFTYMGEKILMVTVGEHTGKMWLLGFSLVITAAWVLCVPFITSDITTLEMAALAFYIFSFVGELEQYAGAVMELRSALYEYVTLQDFVDRQSGVGDVPNAVELPGTPNPSIEFKNVTFSYGGKLILDDISFKVEGGQILGLVGSSGCGKSTIMRLLMRFYQHTSGTITVDGHDITKVTGKSLRKLFSVVTQDSQMINASIRDNIEYGRQGASDADIESAASLAELSFDDDLNLDKVCGEKGGKLSGGQQQRVSLARAMLKNGTIYLLDEPTTGLDGIVARQLQQTLDKLASNATTLMVTHHLQDLKRANQIIYLEQGKIVESGTYDELIAQEGVFFRQTEARNHEAS